MKRTDFLKWISTLSVAPWIMASATKNHSLIKPSRLKRGDTVGLVAPAGIIYDDSEFGKMKRQLSDMGLKSTFGASVKKRYGYFAGTDRERADDLNRMFADSSVDGIMAVRGGWGCARILPYLNFKMIAQNPKIYCGFSDNTTLHHAFLSLSGLQSFHGPNGNSEWTELTRKSFQSVLMDGDSVEFISKSDVKSIRKGKAEGRLIGGNLTILTTTLGTPYEPDFSGAILFVEDISENTYKIDRMLAHLKQSGALDEISGFIFGKCTDCSAGSDPTFSLMEVLNHHIKPLEIPAIFNADIGHEEDNLTIPMGAKARLDAGRGIFSLLEPAVV